MLMILIKFGLRLLKKLIKKNYFTKFSSKASCFALLLYFQKKFSVSKIYNLYYFKEILSNNRNIMAQCQN